MSSFSSFKIFILCLFILSGCSVGPDYKSPSLSFLNEWLDFDLKSKTDQPTSQDVSITWWEQFNDDLLTSYIEQAMENNKDVEIARANILKARAARKQVTASFFPSFSADGSASREKRSSQNTSISSGSIENSYDASFDASWEIDIFGGNRRAVEASDALLNSTITTSYDVMLSTLSDVARTYYEVRGLQKRIAYTEKNALLLKKTRDVIKARLDVGEASDFDLSRAEGEYQLTKARIPNLQADLYAAIYSLSVLLGQPPEALLSEIKKVKALPTPPDTVPVGLKSDLLRRRPDIRTAEYNLQAATAEIGVQTAELFPKFFLTGSAGSQARVFGDLFTSPTQTWSFGGLVQWSIFEGGAIRAAIEGAEAETQASLAQYEKTVLSALADTETALTRYGQEIKTRHLLEAGVKSRKKSVSLAQELFNTGEEDYLAVLDAERELISSEDDLIISETQAITKLVSLYTALGGGWQAFE